MYEQDAFCSNPPPSPHLQILPSSAPHFPPNSLCFFLNTLGPLTAASMCMGLGASPGMWAACPGTQLKKMDFSSLNCHQIPIPCCWEWNFMSPSSIQIQVFLGLCTNSCIGTAEFSYSVFWIQTLIPLISHINSLTVNKFTPQNTSLISHVALFQ